MSKKRLEEIKKRLALLHSAVDVDDEYKNYIFKDLKVEWLIEQAERVKELELEVNDWRDEVKKWQRFYEESEESHLETMALLRSALNQNKRYRKALEFYADEKSWTNRKVTILMDGEPTDVEDCPAIFDDGGNIARQTLEGEE